MSPNLEGDRYFVSEKKASFPKLKRPILLLQSYIIAFITYQIYQYSKLLLFCYHDNESLILLKSL